MKFLNSTECKDFGMQWPHKCLWPTQYSWFAVHDWCEETWTPFAFKVQNGIYIVNDDWEWFAIFGDILFIDQEHLLLFKLRWY